jgi:hypothetical protein
MIFLITVLICCGSELVTTSLYMAQALIHDAGTDMPGLIERVRAAHHTETVEHLLLRFLRARSFCHRSAFQMLTAHLEWRWAAEAFSRDAIISFQRVQQCHLIYAIISFRSEHMLEALRVANAEDVLGSSAALKVSNGVA